jgi:hypothetical protein
MVASLISIVAATCIVSCGSDASRPAVESPEPAVASTPD